MEWIRPLRLINWVSMAITTATGLGLWLIFNPSLPPGVPLFYGLPWGESQLAKPTFLILPTAFGALTAILIGLGLGRVTKEKPLAGMLVGTSIVVQLIATLAVLRIVLLVG